jgi:hypothetical protein
LLHSAVNRRWVMRDRIGRGGFFDSQAVTGRYERSGERTTIGRSEAERSGRAFSKAWHAAACAG